MDREIIIGRIWVLAGREKNLIEDIDTDQIFHNAHLHITDPALMGQYALGNLEGWTDFPEWVKQGDILIAGRNFGAGSSRQQAVDCFTSLGVAAVIAPSFGAIYFRNAVNSGFLVLRAVSIGDLVKEGGLQDGDEIRVDLRTGKGRNESRDVSFLLEPMSEVQLAVYEAGSLFGFAKTMGQT